MASEHFDVLVAGAGISGICAGYHLQTSCPGRTYAILEARGDIGGTWDLFRYPGIRSDSDMYTLGYSFKPWTNPKAIADGWSILEYLRDTSREYGIDRKIRFGHRVKRASWSSAEARWTVEVERGEGEEVVRFTCNFLFMCSGYYNYAEGYVPQFPGRERFAGRIVHPQKWTEDIDYVGKRVVVVGSGATAVTLLPEIAKKAAHVTMLQRSPTYIISMHPRYNPWEQRLCLVPDSDLFKTMRQGRASVVTDQIETFTEKGLKLRSGAELETDLVVTATGLNLLLLGGLEATVDGVRVDFAKTFNYKGMMFSDVPNLALAVGYTNASWTLKAELICRYVCRLLKHMEKTGTRQCTPRLRDPTVTQAPFIDLTSGYVQRAIHMFPKQGSKVPWKLYQNYARDLVMLQRGNVEDGVMEFSNPAIPVAGHEETADLAAERRRLHV